MIAIADSSPIILLTKAGYLFLLLDVFERVLIPEAVYREVLAGRDRPGAREVAEEAWLTVQPVANQAAVSELLGLVHRGEAEVIALGQEVQEQVVLLLDDRPARRLALRPGLAVAGTGVVLTQAKERGLIPAVRPVLDELRAAGMFLGDGPYRSVLADAGELA